MYTKKNSGKKIAVLLLAVVLLIGVTVGGTLAWLSAEADDVINTFTAGNITITLTETFNAKSEETLNSNDKWVGKIVPGNKENKDPKITVEKGSEKCYVYALVENNMVITETVEGATVNTVVVIPNINVGEGEDWQVVKTVGNKTLYRYKEVVDASADAVECQVFTEVTYDGAKITEDNIPELAAETITIDAFAHQSENTDQATADAAAIAHFSLN